MQNRLSKTPLTLWTFPAAIFLTAISLLIYADTLNAPFVFDDLPNITQVPRMRMTQVTPEALVRVLKITMRPVANLSFAFNYYFHGYDVRGFHVINLAVHVLTAVLLLLISRQTLRLCNLENRLVPLFAAVLWLVNPVHTQSVTYIVQRMNSMPATFFMLALFCYIHARMTTMTGQGRFRSLLLSALCLLAAILGLASKQIVATLPVIIFLYEWIFFQNLDRGWLKKQIGWISVMSILLIIIALIYMGGNPIEKLTGFYEKKEFTPVQRLLTESRVVIFYLSLLFFPHPNRLNLDYDFPLSDSLMNPAVTGLSLLAIMALFAVALYRPGRHRLLSFAILWFLCNLAIESTFLGLDIIFEHRTYLPSLFPTFVFAALLFRYLSRPIMAILLLSVFIIICGNWASQRNIVWNDTLTLWQDCSNKSPRKARPANGVGMAYQAHQQHERALEWFQEAVQLNPEYNEAYSNIGGILIQMGRPAEAVPHLERAITLDPENYEAFSNLGSAKHHQNLLDEAVEYYLKSIRLYPDFEAAHNNLGAVLTQKGDIEGAMRHLNQAIRINPRYTEAHNNLGLAMAKLGREQDAIASFQQALRLNPDYAPAHLNLGIIRLEKQDMDRARDHLQQAVQLNPQSVNALDRLATVFVMQGQYHAAEGILMRLTRLTPDSPTVYYNLACVYALQNKTKTAVAALKKAVANGYDRWDHMKIDTDLENIYATPYFKELVRLNDLQ